IVRVVFHDKACDVFVVFTSCKNNHRSTKSCIGNPHFLPIDFVMLSVCCKLGCCFSRIGIRTSSRFGQTIRSKPFSRCYLRNAYLLLLFCSVQSDWHCPDSCVSSESS